VPFHLPVFAAILLSDRNRADLDWQAGAFTWRYRNKLAAERSISVSSYHLIPYVAAEPFYESKCGKWSTAWGTGGWRFGGGMASVTPETTDVGTLVVDIYDANGKEMIWRGISQGTLSHKGEKNEKELNKAIDKMFKQYP
jgi:hypothetical protein